MTDFSKWLDGLPLVEEDHVFIPVGAQSAALTELMLERAELLNVRAAQADSEEKVLGERSLAETYTDRRDDVDRRIAEQLEKDHPDALRIRLRGLSDDDIEEVEDEVLAIEVEGKKLDGVKAMREGNLRLVARAVVTPPMTTQDARLLRKKLNRGEWARLLDHVTRLMTAEAESVDLPNS